GPSGLTTSSATAPGSLSTVQQCPAGEVATQGHPGTLIRLAAYGPGAANVGGLTDQTDMHFTNADGLGPAPDAEIPGDPGEDANGNDDSSGADDADGASDTDGSDGSSDAGGSEDSEGSADSAGA